MLDDPRLDWSLLRKYRFDDDRFRAEAAAIRAGTLSSDDAIITAAIVPFEGTIAVSEGADAARLIGEKALAAGKVACMVLNGGMATRFGGVVKGTVDVYDGKSFLALKAEDVGRASATFGARIPFLLMNSFATEAATQGHLERQQSFGLPPDDIMTFAQSISLRLTSAGDLFIGDDGAPSYHAPGHGDFFAALRQSGTLAALRSRGIEIILFSNVDNLGATIDPLIIGQHLANKNPMTVEVTVKRQSADGVWDKGGAPALVGGRLQLVEGFRFPKNFVQESLPDFSTNNMIFDLAAIDRPLELTRHVVQKKVDGRVALQLESIACEASAVDNPDGSRALAMTVLRVPRDGPDGRFFPVKRPIDLEEQRDVLRARLQSGWKRRAPSGTRA